MLGKNIVFDAYRTDKLYKHGSNRYNKAARRKYALQTTIYYACDWIVTRYSDAFQTRDLYIIRAYV